MSCTPVDHFKNKLVRISGSSKKNWWSVRYINLFQIYVNVQGNCY